MSPSVAKQGDYRWYELRFPANLSFDSVAAFVRSQTSRSRHGLLHQSRPIVVEVIGHGGQLLWRIGAHASEEAGLLRAVQGQLPDVRYQPAPPIDRVPSFGWELRTNNPRRPLRVDVPDELAVELLGAVAAAKSKETVILQWLIGPWLIRPVVPPAKQSEQARNVI